jgi:uncharacterized protein
MSAMLTIDVLTDSYAVSQLGAESAIPGWADGPGIVSIGRTSDELSVVCLEVRVPSGVTTERGWRCLMFRGPFAFDQTGILSSVAEPLAHARIGIFAISTFNTDYLMVKAENLDRSIDTLRAAGHVVIEPI